MIANYLYRIFYTLGLIGALFHIIGGIIIASNSELYPVGGGLYYIDYILSCIVLFSLFAGKIYRLYIIILFYIFLSTYLLFPMVAHLYGKGSLPQDPQDYIFISIAVVGSLVGLCASVLEYQRIRKVG